MTVGARLGVDVCNASRGCEENEKKEEMMVLYCNGHMLDWGKVI